MMPDLSKISDRYEELNRLLADPEVYGSPDLLKKYGAEQSALKTVVRKINEYERARRNLLESEEIVRSPDDEELAELAQVEIPVLKEKLENLEFEITRLLLPKDEHDERNTILEIRAGTGGEEAGLFVSDLVRMYRRFAEDHRWKMEVLSSHSTGIGGFKEIILLVAGRGAYSRLKYEAGVHRVQRVPVTDSGGRIHTSAATVAVLPEAEDVEVEIKPEEIRVDVFRSSGPGGQSVNTTDSAVRITHLPTGITVSCQDEKSQHKNRAKALKILRSRLLDLRKTEQRQAEAKERGAQVGRGDRSEKIRTYNFPQNRVTDHRIGYTKHNLDAFLEGDLDGLIEQLAAAREAERLQHAGQGQD
ncbi:MAG: peptide chain release factor 1 [Candidatus Eisenbacteria sp.]|nr:peptide chain release factor 1 [Candidatus Eisenbacteria bacterium]